MRDGIGGVVEGWLGRRTRRASAGALQGRRAISPTLGRPNSPPPLERDRVPSPRYSSDALVATTELVLYVDRGTTPQALSRRRRWPFVARVSVVGRPVEEGAGVFRRWRIYGRRQAEAKADPLFASLLLVVPQRRRVDLARAAWLVGCVRRRSLVNFCRRHHGAVVTCLLRPPSCRSDGRRRDGEGNLNTEEAVNTLRRVKQEDVYRNRRC